MGTGRARCGARAPGRRMEDLSEIRGPPPPRRSAGPGRTPLRSGPGPRGDGGGGAGGGAPGRRRAGSPQAEADRRAGGGGSASPLGLRLRGLPGAGRGRAGPGLRLTPSRRDLARRPRPPERSLHLPGSASFRAGPPLTKSRPLKDCFPRDPSPPRGPSLRMTLPPSAPPEPFSAVPTPPCLAMTSAFIPGLKPRNPHYIPGYTGHCPLLQFSMGQTYGQVTGQLLQGPPGIAWPPARRTLLPPICPPRSPELLGERPPLRRGHERLSSSMIPGYTGFVPQAQFIFAKNCSQVWAEALNDFTQWHGRQRSQELLEEAKEEKDTEEHQEPKAEEPEQKASPYSMDDTDPQKFFMSGFTGYVPRARFLFGCSFPVLTNQALQEFGQKHPRHRAQEELQPLPPLPRTYLQNAGLLPHYGGYVPGYKFQFGHTFGHLTQDALGLNSSQKQLLA
ncbi:protein FAM166B [Perognathus longimembris pacificus]|uniref:protein FAM166B n=1 Tax=Perognathus longimembris pacificus TaxID=214514 RepID=UPI00201A0773|nr:protein FAM166B [Perognathus longimembris pacificus]